MPFQSVFADGNHWALTSGLIHFPIALVLAAAVAEATMAGTDRWQAAAVGNVRAGALFAILAVIAGWGLALDPVVDTSSTLEWQQDGWERSVRARHSSRR